MKVFLGVIVLLVAMCAGTPCRAQQVANTFPTSTSCARNTHRCAEIVHLPARATSMLHDGKIVRRDGGQVLEETAVLRGHTAEMLYEVVLDGVARVCFVAEGRKKPLRCVRVH